jgi:hypothetical protein
MLVTLINRQLEELEYQYQDSSHFPDRNQVDDDVMLNGKMSENLDERRRVIELESIREILEDHFQFEILSNNYEDIKDIYNFFVGRRLENISRIISIYIYENIDRLYDEYRGEANIRRVDRQVDLHGEPREVVVVKQLLQYVIADALKMNLTEYMENSELKFINNMVDFKTEGISPYEYLTESVRINDMHMILNIAEKVKIKINQMFNIDEDEIIE